MNVGIWLTIDANISLETRQRDCFRRFSDAELNRLIVGFVRWLAVFSSWVFFNPSAAVLHFSYSLSLSQQNYSHFDCCAVCIVYALAFSSFSRLPKISETIKLNFIKFCAFIVCCLLFQRCAMSCNVLLTLLSLGDVSTLISHQKHAHNSSISGSRCRHSINSTSAYSQTQSQ